MSHTVSNGLINGYTDGQVNGVVNGETNTHSVKKQHLDGFSTRAIHVGSEPDEATGAVIPLLSLSTTYNQTGVGNHMVRSVVFFASFYELMSLSYQRVLNILALETRIATPSKRP
jgi:hypothetical protein